jgi:predicted MFS family arabinose efflux permease
VTDPRAPARPSLWRRRTFRIYWAGGLVSNIGTWLQSVTGSVVVLQLTGSPVMVGVLNFATFAPILFLSLWGGLLSDRFDRRRVVIATHAASLVLAAVLTVLSGLGALGAVTLIVLCGLLGCSYALAKPALSALLPQLVAADEIASATAVNTLQFNLGQVVGSALSALLLAVTSPTAAFAVNTLSFAGPIGAMLLLRSLPASGHRRARLRGGAREGLRVVARSPMMLALLAAIPLANAATEGLRTLAPEITAHIPGLTADSAGALVTCYGVGATAGLLSFTLLARRVSSRALLGGAFGLQALGLVGVALTGALVPSAAFAVPIGVGFAFNIPVLSAGLQILAGDEFRGRVMSLFSMAHLGVRPFFSLLAGGLATVVAARWVLLGFTLFPLLALTLTASTSRALASDRTTEKG